MYVPGCNDDEKSTKQINLFKKEVVETILSRSPNKTQLVAQDPTKDGPKPVWIQTWSLTEAQDDQKFLNTLKEATKTENVKNNDSGDIYMVSRLDRKEYQDFASKMGWTYVTEVNEIMCHRSNLQLVIIGFPTLLKKFEEFISLVNNKLIIITEFKWER